MRSKQLGQADLSGEALSRVLFPEDQFHSMLIDFDSIYENHRDRCWTINTHLLIDKPVEHFNELPDSYQKRINQVFGFIEFLKKQSNRDCNFFITLFFAKDSINSHTVLRMNKDQVFVSMTLAEFSLESRKSNFWGRKDNFQKSFHCKGLCSEEINQNRMDNSSFSFTKSCLAGDEIYGLNIDQLFFDPEKNKCVLFEYLLCEEGQVVSPHTSHPNRYMHKNSQKFIHLFNFSQQLNCNLFLINYAKPGTRHHNKVRVLQVNNITDKKQVITKNWEITLQELIHMLEKRLLYKKSNTSNQL